MASFRHVFSRRLPLLSVTSATLFLQQTTTGRPLKSAIIRVPFPSTHTRAYTSLVGKSGSSPSSDRGTKVVVKGSEAEPEPEPEPEPEVKSASSYMFPNLHQKVKDALEQDPDGAVVSPVPSFDGSANFDNHQEVYYTHVMGNFRCSSNKCKREWGSKKVSIEIVRFKKNKYNASVFGQRCEKCNELGMLKLHEKSYVDRVVYRLKRWAGIKPKKPMRRRPLWDKPPHQRQLCEGCKIGRCKESEDYEEID